MESGTSNNVSLLLSPRHTVCDCCGTSGMKKNSCLCLSSTQVDPTPTVLSLIPWLSLLGNEAKLYHCSFIELCNVLPLRENLKTVVMLCTQGDCDKSKIILWEHFPNETFQERIKMAAHKNGGPLLLSTVPEEGGHDVML